jgi:hypothetical protein
LQSPYSNQFPDEAEKLVVANVSGKDLPDTKIYEEATKTSQKPTGLEGCWVAKGFIVQV